MRRKPHERLDGGLELPLAIRVMLAGVRTSVVYTIGTATAPTEE